MNKSSDIEKDAKLQNLNLKQLDIEKTFNPKNVDRMIREIITQTPHIWKELAKR